MNGWGSGRLTGIRPGRPTAKERAERVRRILGPDSTELYQNLCRQLADAGISKLELIGMLGGAGHGEGWLDKFEEAAKAKLKELGDVPGDVG